MGSSWRPTPPRPSQPDTRDPWTTRPTADISLQNYGRWRSALERTIFTHLVKGQHFLLAGSAIASILNNDEANKFRSFSVIEKVLRNFPQNAGIDLPQPVAFGSYVVHHSTLVKLVGLPPGIEFCRLLYSILPMADRNNDEEFDHILKGRGVAGRATKSPKATGDQSTPPHRIPGCSPVVPAKRSASASTEPPLKRQGPYALSPVWLNEPDVKATLQRIDFAANSGVKESPVSSDNLSEPCAQLTKALEEKQKENARLSVRITQLEKMVEARDIELEAYKAASSRSGDGQIDVGRLAREKRDLVTCVSTLIKDLQQHKERLEEEVCEKNLKRDPDGGNIFG